MRVRTLFTSALFLSTLGLAANAPAHGAGPELPQPHNFHELARAWEFDPGVVIPLLISASLYARGVARIWKATHIGGGIRRFEVVCFASGWLTLVVALVSALH